MFDLRPVGNLLGILVAILGLTMLLPALAAFIYGDGELDTFLIASFISIVIGGTLGISTRGSARGKLNIQQVFLITTLVWLILPIFGAIPFIIGAPRATYTNAFFEAMSGLTTTGSTVFTNLENLPHATLLWRGMLQWFGGVGIVVVAMALLPALKVGGMQIFKSEGFDTMGKVMPRAAEISVSISSIYVFLTVACMLSYNCAGLSIFDATVHAFTTVATGGFSNYDASFGAFSGAPEYVGAVFMILASLPFVRYVQLISGTTLPLFTDVQIRGFLKLIVLLVLVTTAWQFGMNQTALETAFRTSLFNIISILSGTGYASDNYQLWGPFPMMLFFLIGLIGGCAGSTCCSIKIFRFQLLFAAISAQIRLIHNPNGVFKARYEGRSIEVEVFSSVVAFFVMFIASLFLVAIALTLTGLDTVTAISGAAAALANIGPGLGEIIGPAGSFEPLSDAAKWILAMTMLLGRLELLSVFVLFTAAFWRG